MKRFALFALLAFAAFSFAASSSAQTTHTAQMYKNPSYTCANGAAPAGPTYGTFTEQQAHHTIYGTVTNTGTSSTEGVQNSPTGIFDQYGCNGTGGPVTQGLAVIYTPGGGPPPPPGSSTRSEPEDAPADPDFASHDDEPPPPPASTNGHGSEEDPW